MLLLLGDLVTDVVDILCLLKKSSVLNIFLTVLELPNTVVLTTLLGILVVTLLVLMGGALDALVVGYVALLTLLPKKVTLVGK